jgi:hypothetical protein
MQLDFHYYCVAVLARAVGFNPDDALDLGYASQYVDDSTEGGLIQLDPPQVSDHFDPVRTSYFGLEMLHTLVWAAQKRVWIPFHFIPPSPLDPYGADFSYVTEHDSAFGRLLLQEAATEPLANRKRRLCRIGVATHTYADSWSHADFSGRRDADENDVEGIHLYDRDSGEWEHLKLENVLFDVMPCIGHGQAGFFPDLAFQRWKFKVGHPEVEMERDNVGRFLEAARAIYDRLLLMDKWNGAAPIAWDEIEPAFAVLLAEEGEEPGLLDQVSPSAYRTAQAADVQTRCENWKREFAHIFEPHPEDYAYDKLAWRDASLDGPLEWDDYSQDDWQQAHPYRAKAGFWNSMWVHFHRAALRQRHFVLERLP